MSIDWIFGEYKILKRIAVGGMAEVFLAKRMGAEGFEKLLAIKRILPQFSENEDFISMFIDEAKLAVRLTHRNIVQIYDFGNQQGSYYIAMEHVFGKDVRSILKKSKENQDRLPLAQYAYIIAEAAKGLEYAHSLKDHSGRPIEIIHRDISPQNILVSYEGEVMVVDFGIAKAASQSTETRAGVLKGKILYMSPEQAWGKLIDKRSDIYSLGVVLYEMVADRKIFDADSELSMLEKVREGQVEFPPEIFEKVPKPLSRIIRKALAKKPDDRYQSAHEMHVDLEKYLFVIKETLSEKRLSDNLKRLFQGEIQEERDLLAEKIEAPAGETIPVETLPKGEGQGRGKIPESARVPFLASLRVSFQRSDFRIKIGALGVLCILGVFTLVYLLTARPPTSPSPVEVSSTSSSPPPSPSPSPPQGPAPGPSSEEPSKPANKPASEKPSAPAAEEPKAAAQPSPPPRTEKPEKEAPATGPEQKPPSRLADLTSRGPQLLRENRYSRLLELIHQLSDTERQNINARILEGFAHLKKALSEKNNDSWVRWSRLQEGIKLSGDGSATPLLLRIARDPEDQARLNAVSLLENIGDQRALKDLEQIAATDPNWRIRWIAKNAIASIRSPGSRQPQPSSSETRSY